VIPSVEAIRDETAAVPLLGLARECELAPRLTNLDEVWLKTT
jgi:hypothetical protein